MSHQSSRYPSSDFGLRDPSSEIPPTSIIPSYHHPTSLISSASKPETGTNYHAPDYHLETDRLASFQGWPSEGTPTPQQLAIAGFYFTGVADKVRCFCCGVRLRNWDGEDDPRREHARYSANCRFLAGGCPADTTPQVTGSSSNEMQPQGAPTKHDKESHDKRESRLCKICLEEPADIVFLPCGHLVACAVCAPALERCPVCRKNIRGTVRVCIADMASRQKRTNR